MINGFKKNGIKTSSSGSKSLDELLVFLEMNRLNVYLQGFVEIIIKIDIKNHRGEYINELQK